MTNETSNDNVDAADDLWSPVSDNGIPPAVMESIVNHKALVVTRKERTRFRSCVSTLKWNHWFSTRDITRTYIRNYGRTMVLYGVMFAGVGIASLIWWGLGVFSVAFFLCAPVAFLLGRGSLAAARDITDDDALMGMALKLVWATAWERLRMLRVTGADNNDNGSEPAAGDIKPPVDDGQR